MVRYMSKKYFGIVETVNKVTGRETGNKKCSAWKWILAIIGYCLILYVMLSGAKRLENRQNNTYGQDPEYQEYVKKTPILIPFIPLYHLQKCKFIVE